MSKIAENQPPPKEPEKFTTDDYRLFTNNALAFYDRWTTGLEMKGEHVPDLTREYRVAEAMLRLFNVLDSHRAEIAKVLAGQS